MSELIIRAQRGDKAAQEQLVRENSRLVWSIVMRFVNRGCDRDDLYQIGNIGLIKAIQRFDTGFGVKFSTYAVPLVIGEIRRFLRDDGMIKVSRTLKERSAKILSAREDMEKKNGRTPTVSELSAALDISPEQVIQAGDIPYCVQSLDEPLANDSKTQRGDVQPDSRQSSEGMEERLALKLAIAALRERERRIIKLRYYMDKTQVQTARIMGISQVQVSRLEKKILEKMRKEM
ncbi:MAG: SigB/SigF/SigG family RNA polymerase sigma factor [Firmicutes bacterium]|nr:SigB/SigF/SigG family RNA polymerase sigma factor [Bacillota bacterium]